MPLFQINKNPYFPDPYGPNTYGCGESYCHPIALGDTIFTQFYQTPCGANEIENPLFDDITLGAELLTNPSFTGSAAGWTLGSGWAYGTNNIVHTPGNTASASQSAIGLTIGTVYRFQITLNRTAGGVFIRVGGAGLFSQDYLDTSGTHVFSLVFLSINDVFEIIPTSDFDGSISATSVKSETLAGWETNGGWVFSNNLMCHIEGETGVLEQDVADYINAGGYYMISVSVNGYVQGQLDVYIANVKVGEITSGGSFTYYGTPTLTGVVSFVPTANFIGCINFLPNGKEGFTPGLYELKNNHQGDLISSNGSRYDLSPYFSYYQQWVTLIFNIETLEVPYGCYSIEIYDACTITGDNLVIDGNFGNNNYTNWQRLNGSSQYDVSSGELEFIFEPLEGSNIITNGDFSSGDDDWSVGSGWVVGAGAASHTPGSTDPLSQTVTINPAPPAPGVQTFWIQLVMSNWTQGTITVTLSDKTSSTYGMNDTITFPLNPTVAGSVTFSITPSSNFDGSVDDIALHESNNIWVAFPQILNTVNTNFMAGNYELEFDVIAKSGHANIGAAMGIQGMSQSLNYQTSAGTYTVSVNGYVPGGQRAQLQARFRVGNNFYPGRITVDNISAVRVEPFEANYTSECLNYQFEHEGTRMMVAYCDQNAFGFEFQNTGFRLQQRAAIRSMNPVVTKEKEIAKFGNGNAAVVYAGSEKWWLVVTDYVSETFHDAMSIMVDCDHFMIGLTDDTGLEYIVEAEEYSPQWLADGDYSLSIIQLRVRIKEGGQLFNRHL
jgi:hypothetical protein